MNRKLVNIILLVALSSGLFLFGLSKMALTDPDEPFYAETAKEMLERGEWLTPRIFGEPQFEKPPFYYWLVILSFKTFGINEFAARFPSAVFGVLGVIGVYLLGSLLFSEKTALYSSLIAATAIEYIILARASVTDMVLCVLILYTFLFYLHAYLHQDKKIFYLFASFSLGLAVLTKGPVGIILPVFIVGLYLLIQRDLKAVLRFPIISGTIVFLVIAVPWYYLMYKVHGSAFTGHFFGFQNITRFLEPEHRIGDVAYYYIPIVLGGFFPWSIFLPYGVYQIIKKDRGEFKKHLFLVIWILVFFIFFSFSRTKLPTYVFPLFPALAIFIGRSWELALEKKSFNIGEKLSTILYSISLPIGLAVFYTICLDKYQVMATAVLKTGIILSICAIVSLICLFTSRKRYLFRSIVFTMVVCVVILASILSYPLGLYESSKYIAEELEKRMKPGERIGAETDYQRGVAFYLKREDVLDVHRHHIITKFLDTKERRWCVIKDKNHWQLYTKREKAFWVPTYMVYKFGKKVIITNKLPDDGQYIKKRSIDDPI